MSFGFPIESRHAFARKRFACAADGDPLFPAAGDGQARIVAPIRCAAAGTRSARKVRTRRAVYAAVRDVFFDLHRFLSLPVLPSV